MDRDQIEKMRAVVREFDMGQACCEPREFPQGAALMGQSGRCPPPPVRGLCQEAAEIQACVSRLENQHATLRERMFGPVPTGTDNESKRGQPWSMSELLTNSRIRLMTMCDEFELLLSKME